MTLVVKTLGRNCIILEVEASDTINNVKAKIHAKEGFPIDQQRLTFDGRLLTGKCTLSHYNIRSWSGVYLALQFEIKVTTLTGKTITLDVKTSDFVDHVKAKIEDRTGFPYDQQKLIFGTIVLVDHRTLANYNIQKDDTLQVVRLPRRTLSCSSADGDDTEENLWDAN